MLPKRKCRSQDESSGSAPAQQCCRLGRDFRLALSLPVVRSILNLHDLTVEAKEAAGTWAPACAHVVARVPTTPQFRLFNASRPLLPSFDLPSRDRLLAIARCGGGAQIDFRIGSMLDPPVAPMQPSRRLLRHVGKLAAGTASACRANHGRAMDGLPRLRLEMGPLAAL